MFFFNPSYSFSSSLYPLCCLCPRPCFMHSTVVAWYVMSYVTFQCFLTTHKFVLIHLYWYYHCYYYKLSNTESSVALGEKCIFITTLSIFEMLLIEFLWLYHQNMRAICLSEFQLLFKCKRCYCFLFDDQNKEKQKHRNKPLTSAVLLITETFGSVELRCNYFLCGKFTLDLDSTFCSRK